jgi:2-phosphoglycerate kinase
LPEAVVSGLPFPGPSLIAANATPETDIVSAITTAAINNVMRFLVSSHLLSFCPKNKQPTTLS